MKNLLFATLVALATCSCSKDDSPPDPASLLPAETQTGANTFGCLANGKLLKPRDGAYTFGGASQGMILWGGYPSLAYNEIDVHDYKSPRTAEILIHIHALDQRGVGSYIIDESNGYSSIDGLNHTYMHCRVFDEASKSYKFYRSFANSGTIRITRFEYIPSMTRIVSGTFSGRVRSTSNPNDEIDIKLGRFDINGSTLPVKVFP